MAEVRFSGVVDKVLFKRTKDGQETQIFFVGVDLGVEDRLLALQATGEEVEVLLDVTPPAQMHIDEFTLRRRQQGDDGGEPEEAAQ